jgi:hypothetical protein
MTKHPETDLRNGDAKTSHESPKLGDVARENTCEGGGFGIREQAGM